MREEFIAKQDAINVAESYQIKRTGFHLNDYEYGRNQVADSITSDLEDMSPADVRSVEWLKLNITKLKCNYKINIFSIDHYLGYMSALSAIEEMLTKTSIKGKE